MLPFRMVHSKGSIRKSSLLPWEIHMNTEGKAPAFYGKTQGGLAAEPEIWRPSPATWHPNSRVLVVNLKPGRKPSPSFGDVQAFNPKLDLKHIMLSTCGKSCATANLYRGYQLPSFAELLSQVNYIRLRPNILRHIPADSGFKIIKTSLQ